MSTTLSNGATNGIGKNELLALAQQIQRQTADITEYLHAQDHPLPTFAQDSISRPETLEYASLHGRLATSLENLAYLTGGPKRHFRSLCCQGYELAAVQVALDFDFFNIVPSNGQIAVQDLASKAGLDLDRARRIISLLATEFIFCEPAPGFVCHSPSSYLLQSDEEIRSTLHYR